MAVAFNRQNNAGTGTDVRIIHWIMESRCFRFRYDFIPAQLAGASQVIVHGNRMKPTMMLQPMLFLALLIRGECEINHEMH